MNNINFMPCVEKESANGIQEITLSTNAFSNRKIFLFGSIDEKTVYAFSTQIMCLMEDDQSPIDIYINSPGGEVNSGMAIYDLIQACQAPVNMYCIGMAASMGALIFASAKKGHRFILPHSKVMIHEPLIPNGVGGSATSIKSTADSILKTKEMLNSILAKHTGKTIDEIDRATDHDNYMTAEEAIQFGLCDKILKNLV